MHIVMHAGGIPFNGDTIKEQSLGGSETGCYYVAKELAKRGHRVVVFTEHPEGGTFDDVKYCPMGLRSPTQPLGSNWHFYSQNTPHDVNIIQRTAGGFSFITQAKMNLAWNHDIALQRTADMNMSQVWQTNRIMCVSKWFKNQIVEAWGGNPAMITPIHNGVDYEAFDAFELKDNSLQGEDHPAEGFSQPKPVTLLYSSRPERGLENLVAPGGIMEQLLEKAPHVNLLVCGYEHPVEELDGFYNFLRQRVEELPNCTHLGALTKSQLYEVMCTKADAWCYPTEFEEVSCITAMEVMAAGMSIVTTNTGALPETIGDYPNAVIFNAAEGIDISKFVDHLSQFDNKFRRKPYREYTWARTTDEIEEIIDDEFTKASDPDALARHFLRNSDIVCLDQIHNDPDYIGQISSVVTDELTFYDFRFDQETYAKHYADGTEEMYDGPDFEYESEHFINHPRYCEVKRQIEKLPEGSKIIDYGCAHGHFTNFLARDFPAFEFIGIDVSPKAIEVAEAKAKEWELANVDYFEENWLSERQTPWKCDAIILGEILEHVPDPVKFMETVFSIVGNIKVIITTPFGSWEQMSYEKEGDKRFHLHHFERADLEEMFGHHFGFTVSCLTGGLSQTVEALGWYITSFDFCELPACKPINYQRKIHETIPRQTVSLCCIVRDAARDLPKMLESVQPWVDEIIIGVDEKTVDCTREMLDVYVVKNRAPQLTVNWFEIPSPLDIGFDAARNLTLDQATKQWIFWCDSDEEFIRGERLPKYLRNNGWDGYGIPQHHFAVEPLGVLSTDFPVRLFRNKPGIRFKGVVHEHPTKLSDENDGVGFAWVVHELHFSHLAYSDEDVRRQRFQRNISLMARDRQENPDRILGKFLWIRDLSLMCKFELEQNGGMVTPEMKANAARGLELWEETIDKDGKHPQTVRMIKDHLEFYDTLVNVTDQGFFFAVRLSSGKLTNAPPLDQVPELRARFLNKRHLDKFLSIVMNSEVEHYDSKYL